MGALRPFCVQDTTNGYMNERIQFYSFKLQDCRIEQIVVPMNILNKISQNLNM